MRKEGADVPRQRLAAQTPLCGDLELLDVRDDGIGRVVRVARLLPGADGKETLFEPHIVWMNGDRFVLAGFERVEMGSITVHYAQSWLCVLALDVSADVSMRNAGRLSREAR